METDYQVVVSEDADAAEVRMVTKEFTRTLLVIRNGKVAVSSCCPALDAAEASAFFGACVKACRSQAGHISWPPDSNARLGEADQSDSISIVEMPDSTPNGYVAVAIRPDRDTNEWGGVHAYEKDGMIVILGNPRMLQEARGGKRYGHNCDAMGCGSDHVLFRIDLSNRCEKGKSK